MPNWSKMTLTNGGKNLLGDVELGSPLVFTSIKIGSGKLDGDIRSATKLSKTEQVLSILNKTKINENTVKLTAQINNKGVSEGYYMKELGVFARLKDSETDVLFSISVDDKPDFLPKQEGTNIVSSEFNLYVSIGDVENIELTISSDGHVNAGYVDDRLEEHRRKSPIDHPDGSVTNAKLSPNSVDGSKLQKDSVETKHIVKQSVTEEKLHDKSVSTRTMQNLSVDTSKLANASVNSTKIVDYSIVESKIGSNAVTTVKLKDKAVTSAKLSPLSVTTAKLAKQSVTEEKIQINAVTTDIIRDESVTESKLADNSVKTRTILDSSVTEDKLSFKVAHLVDGKVPVEELPQLSTSEVWRYK